MKPSGVREALSKKKKYLIPCVYHFYKRPMVLTRGKGAYVTDASGKKYLDAYAGVGVVNCGHCHPRIVRAALRQLKTLQHTTTIYLTEPMLELARKLARFAGNGLRRSFFCTSGSEANEGAMRLAKLYTGRSEFIAHREALHGRTYLTTAATGLDFWRTDPDAPKNVRFVPSPACGRCPYGLKRATCKLACADAVEDVLKKRPHRIAAMIAEPVHGNGGIHPAPRGYFKKVARILRKHGALLILDEAQTGFGRTGKRFAFLHHGATPDILTVCKALGNGLPVSAFMTTDRIAAAYTRPGASTFGGNPICAEAASATLDTIESESLPARAARTGRILKKFLHQLAKESPWIREVRGVGLMLGAELADPGTGLPASAKLDEILEALKDDGVLAGKTGKDRNVLTLMPPLIIGPKETAILRSRLRRAFKSTGILK